MFNVGSEDKEKLRENMEEIKNLIQGKKDSDTAPQTADLEQENNGSSGIEETSFEDNANPLKSHVSSEETSIQDNKSEAPSFENQEPQTEQDSFNSNVVDDQGVQDMGPSTADEEVNDAFHSGNNTNNNQNFGNQQNPRNVVNESPQQTEQENFSSRSGQEERSQKLFLEVERFEKVKEMINEMQQLTQDIETTSNDLEGQIDDARESEEVAQQLLDNFTERKNEIENVILESEEN